MARVFSSDAIPTPTKKPPRMDLRHSKKKKGLGVSKPKDGIEKPKVDAYDYELDNGLVFDGFLRESENNLGEFSNNPFENNFLDYIGGNVKNTYFEKDKEEVKKKKFNDDDLIKMTFDSKDWVFTQATAVASVNLNEKGQITTDTIKYVNRNANSWTTEIIRESYKTFVGAMNLKDHIDPSDGGLNYGVLIDAVIRRVPTENSGFIYYVDCLIATNRHVDKEWAEAIENGKIKFLSVGCDVDFLQCSKCGHVFLGDRTGVCSCCSFEKGMKYRDPRGYKSIVSEMVSRGNGEGKVEFVELSYLSVDPAFTGAAQGYVIKPPADGKISVTLSYKYAKKRAFKDFKDYIKFSRAK